MLNYYVVSTKRKTKILVTPLLKPAKTLSKQNSVSCMCEAAVNYQVMKYSLLISSHGFHLRLGVLRSCFLIGLIWFY